MKIYQMTATFGKLQHETLTLRPGLNVITAPNEWGKSTWCTFLAAMLYGLDTRAKSTKSSLADKERYAPWSGEPMSGRIDLNWNGRDITIERATRQRVPLGDFRAYETASGVSVPELTAANCAQMLLGVEQSVFRRSAFIRHTDLPGTQDDALRRRWNALVTTGDETASADHLADSLKELKNKCRFNRTGLLPQAEAKRDELKKQLAELNDLNEKSKVLHSQLDEIKSWLSQLYNHQQALAYQAAQENARRLQEALAAQEEADERFQRCQSAVSGLPPKEESDRKLRELQAFREDWGEIIQEQRKLPQEPISPELPEPFTDMTPEDALKMVRSDRRLLEQASAAKGGRKILILMGILGLLAAAGLIFLTAYPFAAIAGGAAVISLTWGLWDVFASRAQTRRLKGKYGTANPDKWTDPIDDYRQELARYEAARKEYKEITSDLEVRLMVLRKRKASLCGDQEPERMSERWQQASAAWAAFDAAQRESSQAKRHVEVLRDMVKPVDKPSMPDNLTQSESATASLLSECALEQQRLQNRLGQYQGRMAVLGDPEDLHRSLQRQQARIAQLEQTYSALSIALDTLNQATAELQRRFAPRITQAAQELLSRMTDGQYRRILMLEDFTLETGRQQEDTLHTSLWRSDGTVDQLYLALRLAVAQELTPEAPLILDDCLVRFDDERMKQTMVLLRELAQEKQIILFTCHGREAQA